MDKLKLKIKIFFALFFFACFSNSAFASQSQNDILYSQEYFDYLIECASLAQFEIDEAKKANKEAIVEVSEIEILDESEELTLENPDVFKLKIEDFDIATYKETIKKEDTKITARLNDKVSFAYNTNRFKNKYNSNDVRLTTGLEITPFKKLVVAGGLETNYRGKDQNPISKKIYITPTLKFNDKFSISFINKMNTLSKSTDHDLSFKFSPFKSKVADFNVYTGVTRNTQGNTSESISFSTNIYF